MRNFVWESNFLSVSKPHHLVSVLPCHSHISFETFFRGDVCYDLRSLLWEKLLDNLIRSQEGWSCRQLWKLQLSFGHKYFYRVWSMIMFKIELEDSVFEATVCFTSFSFYTPKAIYPVICKVQCVRIPCLVDRGHSFLVFEDFDTFLNQI